MSGSNLPQYIAPLLGENTKKDPSPRRRAEIKGYKTADVFLAASTPSAEKELTPEELGYTELK